MFDTELFKACYPIESFAYFSKNKNPNEYGGVWELFWEGHMEVSEKVANREPIPYFYNDKNDKKVKVPVCLWKRIA